MIIIRRRNPSASKMETNLHRRMVCGDIALDVAMEQSVRGDTNGGRKVGSLKYATPLSEI